LSEPFALSLTIKKKKKEPDTLGKGD
jgi:hypothetical protein